MSRSVRLWLASRIALCIVAAVCLPMTAVINGYGVIWSGGRWIAKQGYYSMEINQILGLMIVVVDRILILVGVLHVGLSLPVALEYRTLSSQEVLRGESRRRMRQLLTATYWLLGASAAISATLVLARGTYVG